MTSKRSFSIILLPLLSTSAALHTALMLFAFRDAPIADHTGMGIWWAFLVIYYIVMSNFLRSPRELRSIVILGAVLLVCQLAATLLLCPIFPSFTWWASAVAMWVALYYQCTISLLDGVKPESLMVNVEITVLALFASALVVTNHAMASGVLLHLCIGLFCILTAMMRLRTLHTRINAQNKHSAVGFLLPLILLAAAGFVVLFCAMISGSAAQLMTQITALLSKILSATLHAVGTFFLWLLSLFPQNFEQVEYEAFDAPPLPSGMQEEIPPSSAIMLYILLIAILLGLVIIVLKIWRTVRLQGRSVNRRTVTPTIVKKNSLWETIRHFLQKFLQRFRYHIHYLRSRNTSPGLLVWLERHMRRRHLGRKQGETTAAFLSRLAVMFPHCQKDLIDLSSHLDCYYFGNGDNWPPETVREMRKQLKHGLSINQTPT